MDTITSSLDDVLDKLRLLRPFLKQEFGVSGLWVFGSYVRGEAKESSDLDVLVEFEGSDMTLLRFVQLEQRLSDALGVAVDLIQRSAVIPRIRSSVLSEAIAV